MFKKKKLNYLVPRLNAMQPPFDCVCIDGSQANYDLGTCDNGTGVTKGYCQDGDAAITSTSSSNGVCMTGGSAVNYNAGGTLGCKPGTVANAKSPSSCDGGGTASNLYCATGNTPSTI